MISSYFTRIWRKWMGTRCIGCDRVHEGDWLWCPQCATALPWWEKGCLRCALPVQRCDPEGVICERCMAAPPPFARAAAAFWYQPPVDRWVQRLKFHGQLVYAAALAEAMAAKITLRGDALVPIPLSPRRQRERGFNQAAEIARSLAAAWRLPWWPTVLVRSRTTQMQARLSAAQRQANVTHAFHVVDRRAVAGRHLLLLDDVMTTGATLVAASAALLDAGAARVEVVVAARAAAVPRQG